MKDVIVNGIKYKSTKEACQELGIAASGIDSAIRRLRRWVKKNKATLVWTEATPEVATDVLAGEITLQ